MVGGGFGGGCIYLVFSTRLDCSPFLGLGLGFFFLSGLIGSFFTLSSLFFFTRSVSILSFSVFSSSGFFRLASDFTVCLTAFLSHYLFS